ncbi:hypothetical protein ACSSS7_005766 [Eimeria intestinalis]
MLTVLPSSSESHQNQPVGRRIRWSEGGHEALLLPPPAAAVAASRHCSALYVCAYFSLCISFLAPTVEAHQGLRPGCSNSSSTDSSKTTRRQGVAAEARPRERRSRMVHYSPREHIVLLMLCLLVYVATPSQPTALATGTAAIPAAVEVAHTTEDAGGKAGLLQDEGAGRAQTPQLAALATAAALAHDSRNLQHHQQHETDSNSHNLGSEPFTRGAAAAAEAKAQPSVLLSHSRSSLLENAEDLPRSHSSGHKDSKGSSFGSTRDRILSYFSWEGETARMWLLIGCSAFLVAFAGVSSGLTTGFMAFDELQLLVLQETGSEAEKAQARKVHELLSRRHQLLVTLLVANSLAMEALPLFLDRLVSPFHAVLLAVTLILFFGEILPQAVCTGRNQLAVAAVMTPLVRLLLVAFAFVAIPVAALLDRLLQPSHAAAFYGRSHLRALIGLHQRGRRRLLREASSGGSGDSGDPSGADGGTASPWLNKDEVMVIQGALDMASKTIGDFLVPLSQVYQLLVMLECTLQRLWLMLSAGLTVGDVMKTKAYRSYSRPLFVSPSINPYTLLNAFQEVFSLRLLSLQSRCHLAFVTPDFLAYGEAWRDGRPPPPDATLLGIVTLEDVMEQLIQEEIMDEFDGKKGRPTEVTLDMASCEPESSSIAFSPAAAANGIYFYAATLSRELDAYPLPPSTAAGATPGADAPAAMSGQPRAASKPAEEMFASLHSAEGIATAPCVLDDAAGAAARDTAQSAHRDAASSRSAAADYSRSPSGLEILRAFSLSEQQKQKQRVGVYINPGSTPQQGGHRRGRNRAMQSQDTIGRRIKRRCFTQPFCIFANQQQQQQQQGASGEERLPQGVGVNSARELETVPYAVLMPSRDSRRVSNGSRSSSRGSSSSETPQVMCMLTPARTSHVGSAVSASARNGTRTANTSKGIPGIRAEAESGIRAELLPKEAEEKSDSHAQRQRLPGASALWHGVLRCELTPKSLDGMQVDMTFDVGDTKLSPARPTHACKTPATSTLRAPWGSCEVQQQWRRLDISPVVTVRCTRNIVTFGWAPPERERSPLCSTALSLLLESFRQRAARHVGFVKLSTTTPHITTSAAFPARLSSEDGLRGFILREAQQPAAAGAAAVADAAAAMIGREVTHPGVGHASASPVKVLKVSFPSPTHRSTGKNNRIASAAGGSGGSYASDCAWGQSPAVSIPDAPPRDDSGKLSRSNSSLGSSSNRSISSSSSSACASGLPQGGPWGVGLPASVPTNDRFKKWSAKPRPVEVFVPSCIYFTEDPLTGRPQPPTPSQPKARHPQQQSQMRTYIESDTAAATPLPAKRQQPHLPETSSSAAENADGIEDGEDQELQQWGSRFSFLMASLGAAVGIGSVWRFPAYCYKWGGGAFLLPYLLLLFLLGVPLLAMEMALGQVFRGGHMRVLSLLSPSLRGLAAATLVLSFCICSYYSVFLAWGFIYFFASFSPQLPWTMSAGEAALCAVPSLQQKDACLAARASGLLCQWEAAAVTASTPAAAATGRCLGDAEAKAASFFATEVLQLPPAAPAAAAAAASAAGGTSPTFVWPTALCLVLVWVFVFLGLFRGLRGMKCLCYLSVLLPGCCVLLLMARAVSLPGASLGVSRLFSLDWEVASNPEVWAEAASQVFFSLGVFQGVMSAYASRKPPTQNTTVDAMAVAICNAGLSLISAVAAFAVAGHIASSGSGESAASWEDVKLEGPQLVFVLYPMALASLPATHFFCVIFFLSFILLGVSSVASLIQPVVDLLLQSRAFTGKLKLWVTSLCLCVSCCLLGFFFCLRSGLVVLQTADYHWGVVGLLLIGTTESLAFGWVYGLGRQRRHVGGRAAYGFVAVYVSALFLACCLGFFGGSRAAAAAGVGAAAALLLGGAAVCLSFGIRFSSRKQRQKAAAAAGAAAAAAAAAVYREELAAVVGDDFAMCGFVDAAAAARRTQERSAAAAAAGPGDSFCEEVQDGVDLAHSVSETSATVHPLGSLFKGTENISVSSCGDMCGSGPEATAFWLFWGNVEHLRRNLNVITSSDRRSLRLRPAWSLLVKYIMPAIVCILLFQSLKRGTQSFPSDPLTGGSRTSDHLRDLSGAPWAFQGPTVAVLLLVALLTATGIICPSLFSRLIPADMETGSSRFAAAIAKGGRQPVQHAGSSKVQQRSHGRTGKGTPDGDADIMDDETATQVSETCAWQQQQQQRQTQQLKRLLQWDMTAGGSNRFEAAHDEVCDSREASSPTECAQVCAQAAAAAVAAAADMQQMIDRC